jgi:nucleoid-associated protein YgaU
MPLLIAIAVALLALLLFLLFSSGAPETPVPPAAPAPESSAPKTESRPSAPETPAPTPETTPPTPDTMDEATTEPPGTPAPQPEAVGPLAPSFDIVRVEKDGGLITAGRAEPNSAVTLLDGEAAIGGETASGQGEWVITPDDLLSPGDHVLSLESRLPDGTLLRSAETVAVNVPAPASKAPVLAVAQPRNGEGASRVLQGPGAKPTTEGASELGIEIVDYDDDGRLAVAGTAPEGASVRTYLDNRVIGEDTADTTNRWDVIDREPLAPGRYTLRADQIGPDGQVIARVEIPFLRPDTLPIPTDGGMLFVVQPGNNLWTLARNVYGDGLRYSVIYQANKEQIRDPDLIYPGQVFSVPATDQ